MTVFRHSSPENISFDRADAIDEPIKLEKPKGKLSKSQETVVSEVFAELARRGKLPRN